MAEILSQSEIDELIKALQAAAEEESAQAEPVRERRPAKQRSLRVYDFKRPDKFSKDQMRTLQMIHDNMARYLTTTFSTLFRTVVQVNVVLVDQLTYGEVIESMSNPTILIPFTIEPLPGTCLVEINPIVAFSMIDRLLGGSGVSSQQKLRPLTDIEHTVIGRVVNSILTGFAEAWSSVVEVQPVSGGIETNPMFVQVLAQNEVVVGITFEVRIGDQVGTINFSIPYLSLEPVLPKLSAQHWFSARKGHFDESYDLVMRNVLDIEVPIIVHLGKASIAVGDLINLERNDVIKLDTKVGSDIAVLVGTIPKFAARPGVLGKHMAVRIVRLLESEDYSLEANLSKAGGN